MERKYNDSRFTSKIDLDYTTYAVFSNNRDLEAAVDELTRQGFPGDHISVFLSHQGNLLDDRKASALGEGIIIGTILGSLLGALLSWIIGIEPWGIAELGETSRHWYIATSAVIGGMIGGVSGAMIGLMIPEYRVDKYDTTLREGSLLVKVVSEDPERALIARTSLEAHGGQNIAPREVPKITKRAS